MSEHPVPDALPSPEYPAGQLQEKLPTLLLHVAKATQSSVLAEHSLISEQT